MLQARTTRFIRQWEGDELQRFFVAAGHRDHRLPFFHLCLSGLDGALRFSMSRLQAPAARVINNPAMWQRAPRR